MNSKLGRLKCPDCLEPSNINIAWLPPRGIDPHLVQFKCPRCGLVFYMRPGDTLLAAILELRGEATARVIRVTRVTRTQHINEVNALRSQNKLK